MVLGGGGWGSLLVKDPFPNFILWNGTRAKPLLSSPFGAHHSKTMETHSVFLVSVTTVLVLCSPATPTRIRESWNYKLEPALNYLTKFGVKKGHQVFAYGSSLRKASSSHYGYDETLVLAFTPSSTWDKFYHLESKDPRNCGRFMSPFDGSVSPVDGCYQGNSTAPDLYRVVPCDHQYKCANQHNIPLVHGSNFTFRVISPSTQYYYLFLVGCSQNNGTSPCKWLPSSSVAIDFDVHIVNQDPALPSNPFTYEFSYNLIGLMLIYIIFSCIYFTVLFFHLLMHSCICTPERYKHHRLTIIFTVSLALETFHILLIMSHYCVFSEDGIGVSPLYYLGQALNFISDWLLILVLILIGKGWQITTATVRWKKTTLVVWVVYIIVSGVFFSWIVVSKHITGGKPSLPSWLNDGLTCASSKSGTPKTSKESIRMTFFFSSTWLNDCVVN